MRFTKLTEMTNNFFHVRQNDRKDVIIVTLINATITAEVWNELAEKICNDTKVSDGATVYFDYLIINGEVDRFSFVTVENWRRLGFSGNNIKNCIPAPPEEVVNNANKFFYLYDDVLKLGLLYGRKLENVQQMILKNIFLTELKTLTDNYRKDFKGAGMTDEDIDKWFKSIKI